MSSLYAVALALVVAQTPAESPTGESQRPAASTPTPRAAPEAPAPAAPPATASPGEATAEVLTLGDALRLAKERNLDLKILAAQLDQAEEISWKAWSFYLPQATAVGAWQAQNEVTVQLPTGRVDENDDPILADVPFQPGSQLQAQVEVSQTLFSPTAFFGIRSANKAERAAALSIGNGRRALLFGVASSYYGAAALKQALAVSERLLETAQRQERDARVRYQAGTIAKVGLLRAEIDRARAEQDLKRVRNSFESAKVALATLLDRNAVFDVTEPPPPPLAEGSAEALVQTALDKRLDVRAAREQVDAARLQRSSVWGRYFPNVGAFARYARLGEAGLSGTESWAAGLQLQWQLLDGGLRESDLREAGGRIAESEASARKAEATARQEVLQALLDLDSARANAVKAREQRDLAAENARLVDVSYRAGAATAVELADATAALRTAEIGATTEALIAQLAALRVLQVAGEYDPGAR